MIQGRVGTRQHGLASLDVSERPVSRSLTWSSATGRVRAMGHDLPGRGPSDGDTGGETALRRVVELAGRVLGASWSRLILFDPDPGPDARQPGAGRPTHDDTGTSGSGRSGRSPGQPGEVLCRIAASGGTSLLVEDLAGHPAFAHLSGSGVEAFLGVPVVTHDGRSNGAMCVFDRRARSWNGQDVALLTDLAVAAATELELVALSRDYEATRLRWELSISAAGIGGWDLDVATGELVWDDRLIELFGYDREGFTGSLAAFDARLHPDDRARVNAALQETIDSGGDFESEYRICRPDGTTRWVQARGRALTGPRGTAVQVVGAAYDTTADRESHLRTTRVLESMPAAFFSLDPEWRFTYVNAEAEKLVHRSRDTILGRDVWTALPATVGTEFERNFREAVTTGRPVEFETYQPAPVEGWYEIRAWPTPDGLSVYFSEVTSRRRAQQEIEIARAATDMARAAAGELAGRELLVAGIGADLSSTLDTEEAVGRLAQHLVPELGDWCLVTVVEGMPAAHQGDVVAGRAVRDLASWHRDPDRRELVTAYRRSRLAVLGEDSPVHQALSRNEVVAVPADATTYLLGVLAPGPAVDAVQHLAPDSLVVVPLRARGVTIGLVSLYRDAGRPPMSASEQQLAREIADRAGLALDNARLFTEAHRVAEGLQRSLLSAPAQPVGAQIEVRYTPAARAAQVGGDWYDAFEQPGAGTVLVIGDVMGHDVEAAGGMSQVRSLLRGVAYATGASPAAVLTALDDTMTGLGVETTATAVVARLERDADQAGRGSTTLRWSNAGHPPPVLLHADGTVELLEGESSQLLLGVGVGEERVDSTVELGVGCVVVFFTDGLVERRGQPLDVGLSLLCSVIHEIAGASLSELCDGILQRMVPRRAEDDVALLAVRLTG